MAREGGVVVSHRHEGKVAYWTHPEAVDAWSYMEAKYHQRHRIYPCGDSLPVHWHLTTQMYKPWLNQQEDSADAA